MNVEELDEILKKIPEEKWNDFLIEKESFYSREWWHSKLYLWSVENNGFENQKFKKGNSETLNETPYLREFAYIANGRFSLNKEKVAYFASDFPTALFETEPFFRNKPDFTFKDYEGYINPSVKKNPKTYGYPLTRKLKNKTPILDLLSKDCNLLIYLKENGFIENRQEFYEQIIFARDEKIYPLTQLISQYAYQNNIRGIAYKSVRQPVDENICPGENLILFGEESELLENVD